MVPIRRLILAANYAFRWVRALDFAAQEQWESSWKQLLAMGEARFLEARAENVEAQALYVLVAHRLSHNSEALRVIDLAADGLKDSSGRSEVERKYLMAYLEMQRLIIEGRPLDERVGEVRALTGLCEEIDIEAVPKHLKQKFPLVEVVINDAA